ncbi:MAG: DUF1559 domain-containing protein, partial [Planctomycetota bacterium]
MNLRRGYALADLITALAVTGIAIALFLPAIQQLRESARSQHCTQRLTQIGLKSHNYEAIYGRLPCHLGSSGAVSWNDWINASSPEYYLTKQLISPIGLLAYVDGQIQLEPEFVDFNTYNLPSSPFNYNDFNVALLVQLPEYLCPSELNNQTTEGLSLGIQPVYFGSPETEDSLGTLVDSMGSRAASGITNFAGCMGASSGGSQRAPGDLWQYRGMITSRETVTTAQVAASDGLANTLMFGESIGTSDQGNITQRHSLLCGGLARGRGSAPWMDPGSEFDPMLGRPLNATLAGFSGSHSSGVGFVRGDASVTIVARDVDMLTFYALCGAFDT